MGNSYSNVGSPTAAGYVQAPELPLHLCFFLVVLLVFLGFSWYMSYESAAERFANQVRLLLMASPLALLLTPRTLRHSSRRCSSRRWAQPGTVFTIPVFPEQGHCRHLRLPAHPIPASPPLRPHLLQRPARAAEAESEVAWSRRGCNTAPRSRLAVRGALHDGGGGGAGGEFAGASRHVEECAGAAERALLAVGSSPPPPLTSQVGVNGTTAACDVVLFCYCRVRLRRPACVAPVGRAARRLERRGYFLKLGFITQRQHACTQYFNAATAAAAAAPPPPRRHGYANVDPRCEWTRTEDADTLVVDVSGFRKEELKVLYNTSRKLKVAGERRADGGQWARFLKMFPVPRSCDAGAIRAVMDNEEALLYVILPKGSSSSSSSSRDKKEDEHNVSSQPQGEAAMAPMADGPSSSSGGGGNLYIAQEDEEMGKIDEKEEVIATQDVPRTHGDVDDGNGRWFHLGVFAGLETAVRVHLEDVGVKHGKHLVDAVRDLLGGGDPGGVDVIHTLAEDGQELLIGSGVLDGAPG
uniref:SHSP domain-containing protein n=1 Tax=Oryza nivara TaxID=4536 RepID=A0A0E0GR80_ORYNI